MESAPKKYKTLRPPPEPRRRSVTRRLCCPEGPRSRSLRGFGACRRGCSALGWGRCRRSRPIWTSRRATGSSTRSTTRSCRRSSRRTARRWWRAVVDRAESAPADIVPGLLPRPSKRPESGCGWGVERLVLFRRSDLGRPAPSTEKVKRNPPPARPPRPSKFEARPCGELSSLVGNLRGNDLLIAIERPPPAKNRGSGDRDRRARVRRQPDLGQHPARRLRALDRRRADDPRAASASRCPRQMSGQPIRAEGSVDAGGGRVAGRPDGGDLRAARAGDRAQPARLARRARAGDRGDARPGGADRGPAGRAQRRLPAAGAAARRGARAEPGGRTAARRCSARRCSRR